MSYRCPMMREKSCLDMFVGDLHHRWFMGILIESPEWKMIQQKKDLYFAHFRLT